MVDHYALAHLACTRRSNYAWYCSHLLVCYPCIDVIVKGVKLVLHGSMMFGEKGAVTHMQCRVSLQYAHGMQRSDCHGCDFGTVADERYSTASNFCTRHIQYWLVPH